jgi:hypothetical protein
MVMNNNQYPKEQYEAMQKAFRNLAKTNTGARLLLERATSARKRKLAKRNHRKRMSVQQKRAAQGKEQ